MYLNYPQQRRFTLQRVSNDYSEVVPIAQSMVQYNVKCHDVRPYTPGAKCRFLVRTQQGLNVVFQAVHTRGYLSAFVHRHSRGYLSFFLGRTQQGLNVRFCIQTQQGLTVRYSRLYINSQTNCTYHINKSINLFHFHQNHPESSSKIHKITRPIFQLGSKTM